MTIRYYTMHSHLKFGGVRTVIENVLKSFDDDTQLHILASINKHEPDVPRIEIQGKKIVYHDIPEIGYDDTIYDNKKELLTKAQEIAKILKKEIIVDDVQTVLHIHNVNLCKNSCIGKAIDILAKDKEDLIILLQVHDFAEDSRPDRLLIQQNCTGKKDKAFGSQISYPINDNIHYMTINSRDKELLIKAGIPKTKVSVFPNAINTEYFTSKPSQEKSLFEDMLEQYSHKKGYIFERRRKKILYPVKAIRRKNILEAILILKQLNKIDDNYQLLITLDANSPLDKSYSDKVKNLIREENLPVVIGFGYTLISSTQERKIKDDKIIQFNLRDVISFSDYIITTSVQEGFGFTFLEGWLSDRPVFGRKIDYMYKDFKHEGLDLDHLYDTIMVETFPETKKRYYEKLNKIREDSGMPALDHKEFEEEFSKKIKYGKVDFSDLDADSQIRIIKESTNEVHIDLRYDVELIQKNKECILINYNLSSYNKRLIEIIKIAQKKEYAECNIDNTPIIRYFSDIANIKLIT